MSTRSRRSPSTAQAVWQSLTHYDPTPLEVIEQPWVQWCVVLPREDRRPAVRRYSRAVGARALAALGMDTGVSHCEWFRRADGIAGHLRDRRPSAGCADHHHDLARARHRLRPARGWRCSCSVASSAPARKYAVGAAYLRGQGRGQVRALEGLDVVAQGGRRARHRLPAARRSGSRRPAATKGKASSSSDIPRPAVVVRALHRVISTLRVRLG